jgi:hypothetical protein
MEILNLALSTAALAVATAAALGLISSGVGALIGALIFVVGLITSLINAPDLEFMENDCEAYYPDYTQFNMRRNGGLEIGDQFIYHLKVKNTGRNRVWMRARMRMSGDTLYGGWTDYVGDWANGKNKDGYKKNHIFDEYLIASIDGATPNLKYVLEFEADWRKWYTFIPVRKDLADEVWTVPMNIHALENSISDFYAHTSDYGSISDLKREYEEALEEYRYWDAYEIGELIIKAVEVNEKLTLSQFERIDQNKNIKYVDMYWSVEPFYTYQVQDEREWEKLLTNFFPYWMASERPDDPSYEPPRDWGSGMLAPRTMKVPNILKWNLLSYEESNGVLTICKNWLKYLYTPGDWIEIKRAGLSDGFEYRDLINNLPIRSNLSTNLREQHIEVDPVSGMAEISLTMNLEPYWAYQPWTIFKDTDGDKIVDFVITPPEGYTISPRYNYSGRLDSTITFNLTTNTPKFGLYFFNISVFLPRPDTGPRELIYTESVPFKVGGFSCMVYKDLYPDSFINDSLVLGLSPGEIIPGLIINPPRHYSTVPGIYSYSFHAQDHIFTNYDELIEGIFEVAEFYDMSFTCADPEIFIFDNESAVYSFNVTNFGNVGQQFNITLDDISFAEEFLSHESIYLGPGESQSFTLTLTPIGWGEQNFSINATSEYNSSVINAKITIKDDDINPPEFTNFEILNTSFDVTVIFEVLNERDGDDSGLSNIKVYIDGELLLDLSPNAEETNFSFTFDSSHGEWFMQRGTHELRVEIIDNDFDVPYDCLNASMSGTFEITLINMFYYVDWQIDMLREYIDINVDCCLGKMWNKKLCWAQYHLRSALEYVLDGYITHSLFHDAVTKFLVQIIEFRAEFYNKFKCIDVNAAEFIINSTRSIRNNVVLIMGYTTNTIIGFKTALVEIDLLNLNDLITEELGWWNGWCLKQQIRLVSCMLEVALFKISMGCDIEWILHFALYKLEKAECKVQWLLSRERITQELADTILFRLNKAQEDIEAILNSIQPPIIL